MYSIHTLILINKLQNIMIFKIVITFFNYLYYLFLPEFVIIQKKGEI